MFSEDFRGMNHLNYREWNNKKLNYCVNSDYDN